MAGESCCAGRMRTRPWCVALVGDQDAIGALAADGAHAPLGRTVRPGVRGGVVMIVMFSLPNTVSKLVVTWASWCTDRVATLRTKKT